MSLYHGDHCPLMPENFHLRSNTNKSVMGQSIDGNQLAENWEDIQFAHEIGFIVEKVCLQMYETAKSITKLFGVGFALVHAWIFFGHA